MCVAVDARRAEPFRSLDERAFDAASQGRDTELLAMLRLGETDHRRLRITNLPRVPNNARALSLLASDIKLAMRSFSIEPETLEFVGDAESAQFAARVVVEDHTFVRSALAAEVFVIKSRVTLTLDAPAGPRYVCPAVTIPGVSRHGFRENLLQLICARGLVRSLRYILDVNSPVSTGALSQSVCDMITRDVDRFGMTALHYATLHQRHGILVELFRAQLSGDALDAATQLPAFGVFPSRIGILLTQLCTPASALPPEFLATSRTYAESLAAVPVERCIYAVRPRALHRCPRGNHYHGHRHDLRSSGGDDDNDVDRAFAIPRARLGRDETMSDAGGSVSRRGSATRLTRAMSAYQPRFRAAESFRLSSASASASASQAPPRRDNSDVASALRPTASGVAFTVDTAPSIGEFGGAVSSNFFPPSTAAGSDGGSNAAGIGAESRRMAANPFRFAEGPTVVAAAEFDFASASVGGDAMPSGDYGAEDEDNVYAARLLVEDLPLLALCRLAEAGMPAWMQRRSRELASGDPGDRPTMALTSLVNHSCVSVATLLRAAMVRKAPIVRIAIRRLLNALANTVATQVLRVDIATADNSTVTVAAREDIKFALRFIDAGAGRRLWTGALDSFVGRHGLFAVAILANVSEVVFACEFSAPTMTAHVATFPVALPDLASSATTAAATHVSPYDPPPTSPATPSSTAPAAAASALAATPFPRGYFEHATPCITLSLPMRMSTRALGSRLQSPPLDCVLEHFFCLGTAHELTTCVAVAIEKLQYAHRSVVSDVVMASNCIVGTGLLLYELAATLSGVLLAGRAADDAHRNALGAWAVDLRNTLCRSQLVDGDGVAAALRFARLMSVLQEEFTVVVDADSSSSAADGGVDGWAAPLPFAQTAAAMHRRGTSAPAAAAPSPAAKAATAGGGDGGDATTTRLLFVGTHDVVVVRPGDTVTILVLASDANVEALVARAIKDFANDVVHPPAVPETSRLRRLRREESEFGTSTPWNTINANQLKCVTSAAANTYDCS